MLHPRGRQVGLEPCVINHPRQAASLAVYLYFRELLVNVRIHNREGCIQQWQSRRELSTIVTHWHNTGTTREAGSIKIVSTQWGRRRRGRRGRGRRGRRGRRRGRPHAEAPWRALVALVALEVFEEAEQPERLPPLVVWLGSGSGLEIGLTLTLTPSLTPALTRTL
jgi:hypothetical protein